jgi:CRISPR-associated protein Cse1 (CRISPR_cse1)
MNSFNLVDDPWIPIYRSDGVNGMASLIEAFTDTSIIDLNADPCQRIALMRLLMAIAHRASDLDQPISGYLEARRSSFDLGDERGGFLRLAGITTAEPPETPAAEYLQFQKGFKATRLSPSQIALGLLTFQCCYPGGLCARNLSHEGKKIIAVSAECAPSVEGGPIYSFIIGKTLLDTIARNMLPQSAIKSPLGVPVWEGFSTDTFLGRMLPISYAIVFSSGFECMSYGPTLYSYQNSIQDPWLAYRETKKGPAVVRINPEKSLWRELPAITSVPEPGKRSGSLLLQQTRNLQGAQVWVGGMAKFQSAVKTLVESRFDLSEPILDALRTDGYLSAFTGAEKLAGRLSGAVKTFVSECARFNPKRGDYPLVDESARRYWNRLDGSKQVLFDLMASNADTEPWHAHCFQTARSCALCPQ